MISIPVVFGVVGRVQEPLGNTFKVDCPLRTGISDIFLVVTNIRNSCHVCYFRFGMTFEVARVKAAGILFRTHVNPAELHPLVEDVALLRVELAFCFISTYSCFYAPDAR